MSKYTLETLEPYLNGKKRWSHWIEIPFSSRYGIGVLLGANLYSLPSLRRIRTSSDEFREGTWSARYWLITTQGGSFTGEAYVLYSVWHQGRPVYRLVKVMLCKHKPVARAGGNPRRGWHPAECELCGLDLSVDSGD